MLYDRLSSKLNGAAQIILLNKLKIFLKVLILDSSLRLLAIRIHIVALTGPASLNMGAWL